MQIICHIILTFYVTLYVYIIFDILCSIIHTYVCTCKKSIHPFCEIMLAPENSPACKVVNFLLPTQKTSKNFFVIQCNHCLFWDLIIIFHSYKKPLKAVYISVQMFGHMYVHTYIHSLCGMVGVDVVQKLLHIDEDEHVFKFVTAKLGFTPITQLRYAHIIIIFNCCGNLALMYIHNVYTYIIMYSHTPNTFLHIPIR